MIKNTVLLRGIDWRAWLIISREIPTPLCFVVNQRKSTHRYWNCTNSSTNNEDRLIGKGLRPTVLAGVKDSIREPFRPFRKALNVWHVRRVTPSSSDNDCIEVLMIFFSYLQVLVQTCFVHFALRLVVLYEVFTTSFNVKVQPIRLPSSAYLFWTNSTLVL